MVSLFFISIIFWREGGVLTGWLVGFPHFQTFGVFIHLTEILDPKLWGLMWQEFVRGLLLNHSDEFLLGKSILYIPVEACGTMLE